MASLGFSRVRGLLSSLCIVIVLSAITLITVEVLWRYIGPDYVIENAYYSYGEQADLRVPYPYIMRKASPGHHRGEINSLGYRGAMPLKVKSKYRILVFGGSTVLGSFGSDNLTSELAKQINKDVEVINMGVASSVSNQSLARFVFDGMLLEPDLVIFYNGGNDLDQLSYSDPRPGYPMAYFALENNPFGNGGYKNINPIFLLLSSSKIMHQFFPKILKKEHTYLEKLRKEVDIFSASWEDANAKQYLQSLARAQFIAKGVEAEFISFFQPTLVFRENRYGEEKEIVNPQDILYGQRMRDKILKLKKQSYPELNMVDVSHIFDEVHEQVFTDTIHIKIDKEKYLASQLIEVMSENKKLKKFQKFIKN